MIDPPVKAFRRRALELHQSALREKDRDIASACLLLFYAVECALKYVYMSKNMLKTANEQRAGLVSARDLGHDLVRLISDIKVPRSAIPLPPVLKVKRTGAICPALHAHQAWRYGENLSRADDAWTWLGTVMSYCQEHL